MTDVERLSLAYREIGAKDYRIKYALEALERIKNTQDLDEIKFICENTLNDYEEFLKYYHTTYGVHG